MNKTIFPRIALTLGGVIVAVIYIFGIRDDALPLLTMLLLNEFGFILTAIGSVLGTHLLVTQKFIFERLLVTVACAFLAMNFLWFGVSVWQSSINI